MTIRSLAFFIFIKSHVANFPEIDSKLDVFRNPRFGITSGEWKGFGVDVSRFFFVRVHCYLIGHSLYSEQKIPTLTGGVS